MDEKIISYVTEPLPHGPHLVLRTYLHAQVILWCIVFIYAQRTCDRSFFSIYSIAVMYRRDLLATIWSIFMKFWTPLELNRRQVVMKPKFRILIWVSWHLNSNAIMLSSWRKLCISFARKENRILAICFQNARNLTLDKKLHLIKFKHLYFLIRIFYDT